MTLSHLRSTAEVLLFDSDPVARQWVFDTLSAAGLSVVCAEDEGQGLALFYRLRPCVLLVAVNAEPSEPAGADAVSGRCGTGTGEANGLVAGEHTNREHPQKYDRSGDGRLEGGRRLSELATGLDHTARVVLLAGDNAVLEDARAKGGHGALAVISKPHDREELLHIVRAFVPDRGNCAWSSAETARGRPDAQY